MYKQSVNVCNLLLSLLISKTEKPYSINHSFPTIWFIFNTHILQLKLLSSCNQKKLIVGGNNYMLLDPFKYLFWVSLNTFYSAKCTVNKWLCIPFYFYFKLKTLTEMETLKQWYKVTLQLVPYHLRRGSRAKNSKIQTFWKSGKNWVFYDFFPTSGYLIRRCFFLGNEIGPYNCTTSSCHSIFSIINHIVCYHENPN